MAEDAGDSSSYQCRVCGRVGKDPRFCRDCLADTMRPSSRPLPAEAPESESDGEAPAVALPMNGTLDLHTFAPRELEALLAEFLASAVEAGLTEVRVVHGKGTGVLRRRVQALLGRSPLVERFATADEAAGGWGATLVTLRR